MIAKRSTSLLMCVAAISFPSVVLATPNRDIFAAIDHKSLPGVISAIRRGANVNARDRVGNTAFMEAVYKDDINVARYLLKHGANPFLHSVSGATAGDLTDNYKMIRFLNGIGVKTFESADDALKLEFFAAVEDKGPTEIRQAISDGANLAWKDEDGHTAIMIAAENGKLDNIQYLVKDCGAKVDIDGLWLLGKDKATRNLLDKLGAPHSITEGELEQADQDDRDHHLKSGDLDADGLDYTPPQTYTRFTNVDGTLVETDVPPSIAYIEGNVFNSSARSFSYVEVKVVEYNSAGVTLGTDIANTEYLGPHERWNFRIPIVSSDVARYKIIALRGDR
jgi:hypothetical protein